MGLHSGFDNNIMKYSHYKHYVNIPIHCTSTSSNFLTFVLKNFLIKLLFQLRMQGNIRERDCIVVLLLLLKTVENVDSFIQKSLNWTGQIHRIRTRGLIKDGFSCILVIYTCY